MGFLSNLFAKKESPLEEFKRETWKLIEDEEYQNSLLNDLVRSMVINGPSVDKIPNAIGRFGLEQSNPIPVNGMIGELAYLSQLETSKGERLLFHRIGAIDNQGAFIDVFEAVTYSGSSWHIFFIDNYHPRRSKLAPEGFCLKKPKQFSGFNTYCDNFPYDFFEKKEAQRETGLLMAYIPSGNISKQIENQVFQRPVGHREKIETIRKKISSFQT